MHKQYKLEFTYTTDNNLHVYEVQYDKECDKDTILEKNIQELITKYKATNIVVREICMYKVL